MCTCGAISATDRHGEPIILLGKTLDFYESAFWHGKVTHTHGFEMIGCGLIPQIGINSGLNEKGLGVILSFLDYRGPFEMEESVSIPSKWSGDDRALINAQLLAKCSNVAEAVDLLYEKVPEYPEMPGGNHMLADANGTIAVFEHCNGQMNHRFYTDEGYCSRGNNGFLTILEEQSLLPEAVQSDRNERSSAMGAVLEKLRNEPVSGETALDHMKKILGSHLQQDSSHPGNICIHDFALPGARASTHLALSTVTALIFNLVERKMVYTTTNPCQHDWYTMDFSRASSVV